MELVQYSVAVLTVYFDQPVFLHRRTVSSESRNGTANHHTNPQSHSAFAEDSYMPPISFYDLGRFLRLHRNHRQVLYGEDALYTGYSHANMNFTILVPGLTRLHCGGVLIESFPPQDMHIDSKLALPAS